MTDLWAFATSLEDLPEALLVLANGERPDVLLNVSVNFRFDDEDREKYQKAARRSIFLLIKGETSKVGKAAVKQLQDGEVSWTSHYEWSDGLQVNLDGLLEPTNFEMSVAYATARLADLCARDKIVLFRCDGCEKFAKKDKRGSGNRNNKNWCSTRCRNRSAQKQKRQRDKAST